MEQARADKYERERALADRRAAEERQRKEEEARRQAIRNNLRMLNENAERATNQFKAMPICIQQANDWEREARRLYADGAFSPFWSAIEQSYVNFNSYRSAAESISAAAILHADYVESLVGMGVDVEGVSDFPVELDSRNVTEVLETGLRSVGEIVYAAQKEPVFAQIWEQRRTTSAVETGFRDLEGAVRYAGDAIYRAVGSLDESLRNSHSRLSSSMERLGGHAQEISRNTSQVLATHSDSMAELTRTSRVVRRELERARWRE